MASDAGLLRLLQLFDSQYPVGAFAHSGGIETYAALGATLPRLRELIENQIELGWGRSELAGACLAWRASDAAESDAALAALARRVHAAKTIPAVRGTSVRLGKRTLALAQRLYPDEIAGLVIHPPHHAVVIGATARALGIDVEPMLLALGHSLAAATLAAATRCMPVSPVQAQTLLTELHGSLVRAVARAEANPDRSLFTCTPALDVRAHHQAFLRTRLFQS